MAELVVAKMAGPMVNIAELVLECVDSIRSILRGMKENKRSASQLLESVEAIESPLRAIQRQGTDLSRSESLRQLFESVQEIRRVLDAYARTCVVARALRQKKIAKKFAGLGNNLTLKMHAVQLDAIAYHSAAVSKAAERRSEAPTNTKSSVAAPTKKVADVLKEAPKTIGQSAAVGALTGGVGSTLVATVASATAAQAALAGVVLAGIGGAAVGVGVVAYQAMNCTERSQPPSSCPAEQ